MKKKSNVLYFNAIFFKVAFFVQSPPDRGQIFLIFAT